MKTLSRPFSPVPLVVHHLQTRSSGRAEKKELDLFLDPDEEDKIKHLKYEKSLTTHQTMSKNELVCLIKLHLQFDFQHSRAFESRVLVL